MLIDTIVASFPPASHTGLERDESVSDRQSSRRGALLNTQFERVPGQVGEPPPL